MANWVTDEEISYAADHMHTAFNYMFEDQPTGVTGSVEAAQRAMPHHLDCVLALDPGKIQDEYERVFEAAMRVGQSERAVALLTLTERHLRDWTGDAADAFNLQISYMKTFCEGQQSRILEMLKGVAAVYSLAVAGRASYLSIAHAAHAAAINVHDQQKTKETQAKINIMADLVNGAITLNPAALTRSLLETGIDVGKDLVPYLVDDSGADQVGESYRRGADELCQSMGLALDAVRDGLRRQQSQLAKYPPSLFEPLPAICDVRSPDFSYEHFRSDQHVEFGPAIPVVEAERRRYVEEEAEKDSEIDRRLNHGDKGSI